MMSTGKGGCLYISENANSKENTNAIRYTIKDTNFTLCHASLGGAIYLDNIQGA